VAIVNARPADDEAHRDAAGAAPGDVEARLRAALRDAMKTRDVVAAFALRSALSAIGNAGAVPAGPDGGAGPGRPSAGAVPGGGGPAPIATSPDVAGAVPGAGAAEVPRCRLTPADVSGIVRAEAAERATAAAQCEHAGHPDRAERLRREAGILLALLDEME
jgi:hypothetical protein